MNKLKIGIIGLGQRGAAFGMTDGSIGLLGNILNNSNVCYEYGRWKISNSEKR